MCWSSFNLRDGCDTFYFRNSLWEKHPIIFIHFLQLLLMVIRISTRAMLGRIDPLQASLHDTMNRKIEGWQKEKASKKRGRKETVLGWRSQKKSRSLNRLTLIYLCTYIQLVLLKTCFESLCVLLGLGLDTWKHHRHASNSLQNNLFKNCLPWI